MTVMTVSYHPETMRALIAACQTANDELQKAQNLLEGIQSHGDWTCKEKNAIDERMRNCKKMIGRIGENQRAFLQAVKEVENDFGSAENTISNLFAGVEGLLGKILSIPVGQMTTGGLGLCGLPETGSTVSEGHSGTAHGGGGTRTEAGGFPEWAQDLADQGVFTDGISTVLFENLEM